MSTFTGQEVRPWEVWQSFDGTVNSASYTIDLGVGVYQFEAIAFNSIGQATPITGLPEATMIVDLDNTFKPNAYMPTIFR